MHFRSDIAIIWIKLQSNTLLHNTDFKPDTNAELFDLSS